jgi:hypothetical protein
MKTVATLLILAALSCSDTLGPLTDGKAYPLQSINGQPLPWTWPDSSTVTLLGWIKLDNDSFAERHEETMYGVGAFSSYTITGRYTLRYSMLIIDYRAVEAGGPSAGPVHPVDTFHVSSHGLVLLERSSNPPFDTMMLFYARPR